MVGAIVVAIVVLPTVGIGVATVAGDGAGVVPDGADGGAVGLLANKLCMISEPFLPLFLPLFELFELFELFGLLVFPLSLFELLLFPLSLRELFFPSWRTESEP
jgi:hypothetical protein